MKFDQVNEQYQNTHEERKFQYILKPSEYASDNFLKENQLKKDVREDDMNFLV
ncbi:MAG: hypothetical protein HRT47_05035 [Candidatus Caenarcaniphilales bacterium]|nr:hypothetical protein [Candidatus Caenarcaniphilales bacterium]